MEIMDLRKILKLQADSGYVVEVDEVLSHIYSAPRTIYDNMAKTVILKRVNGFDCDVVAGICSTRKKIAEALGVEQHELVRFIKSAMSSPAEYRICGDAPFLKNYVEKPDIGKLLPVMRYYPEGERRYITSSIISARRHDGTTNFSFHRMMLLEGNKFSVRIVPRHLHSILEEEGGKLKAAIFIGVHPAVEIASASCVEPDAEEAVMASALMGGGLECLEIDGIVVPAHAEVVMVGRFTGQFHDEGPFVDLTSTYDGVRIQPVFEVDRIYFRDGWLYRTILPGGAEHRLLMGLPQEPKMLRAVSASVPSVVGVYLTAGGCNWLHAVVSIKKRSEGEGRNAGLAALAAHPSLKMVIVVDDDIDPLDPTEVEWAIATRLRPDKDVHVIPATKGSSLDPSRNIVDETSAKWILDATIPGGRKREEFLKVAPPPFEK